MQDEVTEAKSTFKYKEQLIKADDYSITLLRGIFIKLTQKVTLYLIHESIAENLYIEI